MQPPLEKSLIKGQWWLTGWPWGYTFRFPWVLEVRIVSKWWVPWNVQKSTSDCLGVYRLVFLMSWKLVSQATTLNQHVFSPHQKLEALKFKVSCGKKNIYNCKMISMNFLEVFVNHMHSPTRNSITNIATSHSTVVQNMTPWAPL